MNSKLHSKGHLLYSESLGFVNQNQESSKESARAQHSGSWGTF